MAKPDAAKRRLVFDWLEPGIIAGISVVIISMAFAALASGIYTLTKLKVHGPVEIIVYP